VRLSLLQRKGTQSRSSPIAGTPHLCDDLTRKPTSRAAGRGLVKLLLLDIFETGI
jgi:hypothetical protein